MRKERGFTLLEVLAAFTILALSLGILLEIYGRGARTAALALQYEQALWVAESRLAAAVHGVSVPGQIQGEEANFSWQVQVRPYPLSGQTEIGDFAYNEQEAVPLQEVEAQVHWRNGASVQQIRLSTLRIAPPE